MGHEHDMEFHGYRMNTEQIKQEAATLEREYWTEAVRRQKIEPLTIKFEDRPPWVYLVLHNGEPVKAFVGNSDAENYKLRLETEAKKDCATHGLQTFRVVSVGLYYPGEAVP